MTKKKKIIEQYDHADKGRINNPPAGLVTPESDPDAERKMYRYDQHLDPALRWAGKEERPSFAVDTVSLHVHERVDPRSILRSVQKEPSAQASMFAERRPLREALDFYKHKEGWTNRLVAGDSLLVMNSLLEKEGMGGKVQMVYIDPPYGIKYGSNFQPFVGKRDVKDGASEDLTREPEMIKAFRDTWQLGIHSYLTYLRDRLLLAREMLTESGSLFVQISDENIHRVRMLMDEVLGTDNFVSLITFTKTSSLGSKLLGRRCDYIIWYAKDIKNIKYRQLFLPKAIGEGSSYTRVELPDGSRRNMTEEERKNPNLLPQGAEPFTMSALTSTGSTQTLLYDFEFNGRTIKAGKRDWRTTKEGMQRLIQQGRVWGEGIFPRYVQKFSDFPVKIMESLWQDTGGASGKTYVVQTSITPIQRCLLMTTDPGDLVFDPTCGSGTTAFVAEQWGRRWMTCDTSRVALVLAKKRLMTAIFDYYVLANPKQGVGGGGGFQYESVPHVTLKSIANNEEPAREILYDKPIKDSKRVRVTGPFTVEAVPAPHVKSTDELKALSAEETRKQASWRDELFRTGIRLKGGEKMHFNSIETVPYKYIQAEGETKEDSPKRVLIVFGPEHAPLGQRTVELALQEAKYPNPDILLFCAFKFDPEAAKNIDDITPEQVGMQLLRVDMNNDLLVDDLKKGSRSSESFFFVGRPDVKIHRLDDSSIQVEVLGFDYYNLKSGELESGHAEKIAMWILDTDYDGRSVFPSQVFFPGEGWGRLAKNLRAQIDEEKMDAFRGTRSLPFKPGEQIAVRIIDDRGIESLRIMEAK